VLLELVPARIALYLSGSQQHWRTKLRMRNEIDLVTVRHEHSPSNLLTILRILSERNGSVLTNRTMSPLAKSTIYRIVSAYAALHDLHMLRQIAQDDPK
jgi:hypothetical protein